MFVNELFESVAGMNTLVIYPGRFQPWHKGHKAVYDYLVKNYGSDNVFVATSNKVDPPRSPFTFGEKVQFMNLTGVSADRIIETRDPYKALEVVQNYDPKTTRLIFAVSEKDMSEDPRFSFKTKKDGSPSYFQPMPKDASDMVALQQHGYIMTVPTFNFSVLGQPMRSATEVRAQFADADEATQQQIIKDLFGSYDKNVHDIMRQGLGVSALNELKFPGNDDGERHEDNYPCYDCGSTIMGHHTRLCDLAEDWAVRDLPSLPNSQYWTGKIPKGLYPIAGLEDRGPTNEATDPKFVGFMNKSLGDKVDPAKPAPNLPAEYSKFKIASFDNMPGYRPALKFGMSVLQAMDQQTRQHFINSPDDNDPTDAIIVYLIDIAEKKGFMPKYFVEEDIWEVTDWFDEIFADPNLDSWTDLLKSMSGKPGVAEDPLKEFAPIKPPTAIGGPKGDKDYGQPTSSRYIRDNKFVLGTTHNYILTATVDKWGLDWDDDNEIWYLDSPGSVAIADASEGEIELPDDMTLASTPGNIHDLVSDYLNARNSADLQRVAAYFGHGTDGEMATNEGMAQDEADEYSGWRAEFVNQINFNTFEVKMTNTRSKESGNFIVRPVDMISHGPSLQIETMDVHDLQTGQTASWTSDDPLPDGGIVYAISGMFYDNKELQKKLWNIVDNHPGGEDHMPGLDQRRSIGQEVDADAYIDSQEKTQVAMDKMKKGLAERLLDELYPQDNENKIPEDAAGVGVVASKKQKNDPRYKTSLTVDVHPDTPKKNMRALRLI